MGLEISSALPVSGVQPNFFIKSAKVNSKQFTTPDIKPDAVSLNSDLSKYLNEKAIREMITVNSEISKICTESGFPVKVNMKVLNALVEEHLPQTKKVSLGIVSNLPQEFKSSVNLQALQKASVLHDLGKVLIPEMVVNKPGALNPKEREIMKKHAILSYELLKSTDLDKETLYLVKNHHQNAQKTGYPAADESFVADINLQILSTADMYAALREKRSYKEPYNKNQALYIIHNEMKQGKIHPYVFKALVDYANKEETLAQVNSKGQVFYLKPENRLSA